MVNLSFGLSIPGLSWQSGGVAAATTPLILGAHVEHVDGVNTFTTGLTSFETWAGQEAKLIGGFVGYSADWADYSPYWMADLWKDHATPGAAAASRQVIFTVGPVVTGVPLSEAAAGTHNARYDQLALELIDWIPVAAPGTGTSEIILRGGHEFNQNLFPWYAGGGNHQHYIDACRHFVDRCRLKSDLFKFEWCPSLGNNNPEGQIDPELGYWGDDWVDRIGFDFYYQEANESGTPEEVFESHRDRDYGLIWHRDFAQAQGKPYGASEWGVDSDDKAAYVTAVAAFMKANGYSWQMYWDRTDGINCKISNGARAETGNAYLTAFADGASEFSASLLFSDARNSQFRSLWL